MSDADHVGELRNLAGIEARLEDALGILSDSDLNKWKESEPARNAVEALRQRVADLRDCVERDLRAWVCEGETE